MFSIILAAFFPANNATGHDGSVIFPLYQLQPDQLPDIYDGTIQEWHDLLGEPTLTLSDFVPVGDLRGKAAFSPSAEDLQVEVYLGWTAAPPRVYVAVERYDDVHKLFDGERSVEWNDGIQFMIDADHSAGRYAWGLPLGDCALSIEKTIERGALAISDCIPHIFLSYRYAQQYIVPLPATGRGPTVFLPAVESEGFTMRWVEDEPFAAAGGLIKESPNYSVLEFFVTPFDSLDIRGPAFSLPSELREGQVIGLEMSMADLDVSYEVGSQTKESTLSGSGHVWFDADRFVDFRLLGPPTSSTSVERTTWGDVKTWHHPCLNRPGQN